MIKINVYIIIQKYLCVHKQQTKQSDVFFRVTKKLFLFFKRASKIQYSDYNKIKNDWRWF